MRFIVSISLIIFGISFNFSQSIESKQTIKNDSVYISITNPFLCPIELAMTPLDSTEVSVKASHFILKSKDSMVDALAIPIKKVADTSSVSIKDYVTFKGTYGDPNTIKHDDAYLYALPYPKGKRYKIIQSFGGKFSHDKIHSKYAIDFSLQIGDTITAARDGIVIHTKQNSKEYGDRSFIKKANKILILHNDGTMAQYVHLDYNGALVNVGDRIERGQAIGISGLTGFTTTPHLHFVVYKEKGISVPVYFKGYKGQKLKKGKRYRRRRN